MRIAVLSDIHDNIWKLDEVLRQLDGMDALLFCGDFCAPFTLADMAAGFAGPVHVVFGNNDGDQLLLSRVAAQANNVILHGDYALLELDSRKIAVTHYPELAGALAASGLYDLVCYGHDHTRHMERIGDTVLLAPGEVMGRFGVCSYATYDTDAGNATIHTL